MKQTVMIALLISVLAGFACKKSDINKSGGTLNGVWQGNYTIEPAPDKIFYSLRFDPNGVLEELSNSGAVKGTGEWEIDSNNIITATYFSKSGTKYSLVGAFYPQQNKILGNWGWDDSATNGGTYELTR